MARRANEDGQSGDRAEIALDGATHRMIPRLYPAGEPGSGCGRALEATIERVVRACLKRLRGWPVPPNWSAASWLEELEEVAWLAAWQAARDFDPSRGVRLVSFVWWRVMQHALARSRQECAYARPLLPEAAEDALDAAQAGDGLQGARLSGENALGQSDHNPLQEALRDAIADLPQPQRWLLHQLFWEGRTEVEVTEMLGISQGAVSQRKKAVLLALRAALQAGSGEAPEYGLNLG